MIYTFQPQAGPQELFLSCDADIAVYGGARGGGKLLDVDTPIPMVNGWKRIGDIQDGDHVFSEKGDPVQVLQAFDVEIPERCYRITFDDGSTIDAGGEHLWWTFTHKERRALTRNTTDWKAKRRAKRPSRAKSTTSKRRMESLRAHNQRMSENRLAAELPTGKIRSTDEIASTLKFKGEVNHSIPVAKALELQEAILPIDPYTLGAWLGDGTSSSSGFTGIDPEIWEQIKGAGYSMKHYNQKAHSIEGFVTELRKASLLNNKHIPTQFLRASRAQRLALLQGLMDTDGTVGDGGSAQFDNCNEELIDGVFELIVSLGWKVRKRESRAMLYGRDCGPKWRLTWTPSQIVFRLPRKAAKQRIAEGRTTNSRYIIDCQPIPVKPMRCLRVDSPSHLFLAGKAMVPTHNSYGLLLDHLRHVRRREYGGVIFRRTNPQIFQKGGLWDTSEQIYPFAGGRGSKGNAMWRFPSGATINFRHMENDSDRYDWLGAQIPNIGFDELATFTESQFFFMLGSNRDPHGQLKPYIRGTTNPEADTWLSRMLSWYWNPTTGYAIEERSGKIRWFVRVDDSLQWADDPETLKRRFPESQPTSFTFIAAKVHDNKILLEKDPSYLAKLLAQGTVDRERYLHGNWKIKLSAGMMFRREWFKTQKEAPNHSACRYVRRWDLAATPDDPDKDPDYTAGVLLVESDGITYVKDVKRLMGTPKQVEDVVRATAQHDGTRVSIRMEEEGGSSGKTVIDHYARNVLYGYNFLGVKSTGSKVDRAKPASSAAQAGNIVLIEGPWNDAFLDELEGFPVGRYDDQVDGLSGGHSDLRDMGTGAAEVLEGRRTERYAGRGKLII